MVNGNLVMAALFPNDEIWADLPGFSSYQVSSKGRMRRLSRRIGKPKGGTYSVFSSIPRFIKLSPTFHKGRQNEDPHLRVGPYSDGKQTSRQIGYYILFAFVGSPLPGQECCHNSGNPLDNNLENLRWDSRSSNALDMLKHKTHKNAILTAEDIPVIRHRLSLGHHQKDIAADYGVHIMTISDIKRGVTWTHVE